MAAILVVAAVIPPRVAIRRPGAAVEAAVAAGTPLEAAVAVAGTAPAVVVATVVADVKLSMSVSPMNRGRRQAPQLIQPLPLPSFLA